MTDKLPPVPQEFYDENRERFRAKTSAIDIKSLKENRCRHELVVRITPQEVQCQNCKMGWYDMGRFKLKNNKIVSIK